MICGYCTLKYAIKTLPEVDDEAQPRDEEELIGQMMTLLLLFCCLAQFFNYYKHLELASLVLNIQMLKSSQNLLERYLLD
jgi:hypothetical protein